MFYNDIPTKQIVNPYAIPLLSSSSIKNKYSSLNLNNQVIQPSTVPFPKPVTGPFPNNPY